MRIRIYTTSHPGGYSVRPGLERSRGVVAALVQHALVGLIVVGVLTVAAAMGAVVLVAAMCVRLWGALPGGFRSWLAGSRGPSRPRQAASRARPSRPDDAPRVIEAEFRVIPADEGERRQRDDHAGDLD